MTTEILNTNIVNKGAYLMLTAIADKIRELAPDETICVRPHWQKMPYEAAAGLGLRLKLPARVGPVSVDVLGNRIPKRLRRAYGIVLESEVETVLDASGFAYSDQWGTKALKTMSRRTKRWQAEGKKVVLMPQAFGPFESEQSRQLMQSIQRQATLIFARDNVSRDYLEKCSPGADNVFLAPDCTFGFDVNSVSQPLDSKVVLLIPNVRMIDKGAVSEEVTYTNALVRFAHLSKQAGMSPKLLVHEGVQDKELASKVNECLDHGIEIIESGDPVEIKRAIGSARIVVGSRFHGLVSALSQGVPVIAMGWSHKYEELLHGFGLGAFCLSLQTATEQQCEDAMGSLLDPSHFATIHRQVDEQRKDAKLACLDMWHQIAKHVGWST